MYVVLRFLQVEGFSVDRNSWESSDGPLLYWICRLSRKRATEDGIPKNWVRCNLDREAPLAEYTPLSRFLIAYEGSHECPFLIVFSKYGWETLEESEGSFEADRLQDQYSQDYYRNYLQWAGISCWKFSLFWSNSHRFRTFLIPFWTWPRTLVLCYREDWWKSCVLHQLYFWKFIFRWANGGSIIAEHKQDCQKDQNEWEQKYRIYL